MLNAQSKKKAQKERIEIIPDYDHLFEAESNGKKRKKNPFFRKLVRLNIFPLILSTIVLIFQNAPVWAIPICTANIIDLVTKAAKLGEVTGEIWTKLAVNAAVLLVLIIQNVPSTILRWKITSKMLRRTSAGIKSSVIRKLQKLSITYHKDMQTGKIQSKFLKDTDTVDSLFNIIVLSIAPSLLNVLVSVGISFYRNVWVSLFFLIVIPCNVALTLFFRKRIRARYHDFRVQTETMSTKLTTMLEMLPVTKAHGLEYKEIQTAQNSILGVANAGKRMDRTTAHFGAWVWVVNTLLSIVCLAFCSVLALKGIISIGEIVLYQSMFSSISGGVTGLIGVVPTISSGFEALSSVSEIMQSDDVEQTAGNAPTAPITGAIRFENVYYQYPNTQTPVIKDFNLDVRAGECIAVVGSSGSGKTTLMNMIIGLLLPTRGNIFIDDAPITDLQLSSYRKNLSVVPQNSILFAGSIRDNITYGLDGYDEAQIQAVVKMANVEEFAKDFPCGLDTDIGEHGDKLSGGQKQRITIARALIRDPKILILDEATSALDNISEFHVQQAISQSIQGRTTFIVAHRLSTIRNADRILVMENGEVVETGNYEELMAKRGKFYELKRLNELNLKNAEEALA